MTLLLNEPEKYQAFPSEKQAPNIQQMPILIEQGYKPISVAGLMKRKLEILISTNQNLIDSYWNNFFDTGDGIASHPRGEYKIVFDSQDLKNLNPESQLKNGALVLDCYDSLKSPILTKSQLEKLTGHNLIKRNITNNKLWRILARHPNEVPKEIAEDSNLLKEYVKAVFFLAQQNQIQFENNGAMGLYIDSPEETPTMRLWYVGSLWVRSNANGGCHIGSGSGRLLGVANAREK